MLFEPEQTWYANITYTQTEYLLTNSSWQTPHSNDCKQYHKYTEDTTWQLPVTTCSYKELGSKDWQYSIL